MMPSHDFLNAETKILHVSRKKTSILERKSRQLSACLKGEGLEGTTLWDCVKPVHNCLPERNLGDVSTKTTLFGKDLAAPLMVAGMTGGTLQAQRINKKLAQACERAGIGFGIGSQRAALENKRISKTYKVRDVAPSALILANIGLVQFTGPNGWDPSRAQEAVEMIGADALCIHINPAQEALQECGDTNFENGIKAFERISKNVKVPVIAKETGCGVNRSSGLSLVDAGAAAIDVGGSGGTSWTKIARIMMMAGVRGERTKKEGPFDDWGIPTPASVAACADLGVPIIATGGVGNGLHIAKSLLLGASCAGMARPALQALKNGVLEEFFKKTVRELEVAMFLIGVGDISELVESRRFHVIEPLRSWIGAAKI